MPSKSKKNDQQQQHTTIDIIESAPEFDNPFVYDIKLSFVDKIKLGFGAVFLLPIRCISICLIFLTALIVTYVIMIGYDPETLLERPLTGWRRKGKKALNFLGRSLVFAFGFHRIERVGKRNTKEARLLVAAPHTTFLDAFVFLALGYSADIPSIVSRSTNIKIPIVGYIFRLMQPILVTREDDTKKESTIDEIKRRASSANDWPQVFIFPEGTTTNGSCLISFKNGAFIPGEPVQPLLIQYPNKLDTITWSWIGISAIKVLVLTLCQLYNNLKITYLPVYFPSAEEKQNPKLFSQNIRNIMASHLNLPLRNFTFEDCRLMKRAKRSGLSLETGLIEFNTIKHKLDINYETCAEILEKFAQHCRKPEGKMGMAEFASYLGMKQSPIVEQIFNIYDKDKIGSIPFRLFLVAHCLLYQAIKRIEILETIIKSFDMDGKGFLAPSDLAHFSFLTDKCEDLFSSIDKHEVGKITLEDLKELAREKPELILLFLIYNEIKQSKTATSIQLEQVINDTETKSRSINMDIENQLQEDGCDMSNEGTRSDGDSSDDSSTRPIVTCDSKAAALDHEMEEEIAIDSEDADYMTANLNDSDSPHEKLLVKEKKTSPPYLLNSAFEDLHQHHHHHLASQPSAVNS